jgi:hypothetical protein
VTEEIDHALLDRRRVVPLAVIFSGMICVNSFIFAYNSSHARSIELHGYIGRIDYPILWTHSRPGLKPHFSPLGPLIHVV